MDGDGKLTTHDIVVLADQNNDGKLDMEDVQIIADVDGDGEITFNDYKALQKCINDKLPNASGYVAGYFMGLRSFI